MRFALFIKVPGRGSVLHMRFDAEGINDGLRTAANEVKRLRFGPAETILEAAYLRREDKLVAAWRFNVEAS